MESNATHASETDSHVSSQPNVGKQKTKRAHRGPSSKRVDKQAVTDASSVGQEDSPTSSSPVVLIAKTKKARPPADASAPKRACTAFLLFSKDERARVKAEHPTASNAEIARHLGDKWKAADADTKAKYNGLYVESKARADEERRVYDECKRGVASISDAKLDAEDSESESPSSESSELRSSGGDADVPTNDAHVASDPSSSTPVVATAKTKRTRPPADASAPKRACTAFLLFSKDERARVKAEHPTASNAEIARHLGDKWKAADADTKAKYNGLYVESKARADEERRVYDECKRCSTAIAQDTRASTSAESEPTANDPIIRIQPTTQKATAATTKRSIIKKPPADASAPKRACTAFLLFSKDERARVKAEHPTASNAEIARHLGDKWKAADADTKAKYNGLYAESKARADEERRVYDEAMLGDASRACTIESAVESPLTVPILQAVAKAKNVDMGRSSSFIVVSNPEGTSLKCSWKSVLDASMNIAC